MHAPSPTPSFPGAWPDWCSTDIPPPPPLPPLPDITDHLPSLLCLSPRPLPELPSLSSSLSTAQSSLTIDSPTLPEPPCPPEETLPACTSPSIHSPVLNLREPRTPDSTHFSLTNHSIALPSPASSQLRFSLSNNCPGARSTETVDTYLPSPISPRTPDAAQLATGQDEESGPNLSGEETTAVPWPRSDSPEHSPHAAAAKIPMGKRTFLSRVKRIGSRVRKLFKTRGVESKPPRRNNSLSSLVSPRKPPPYSVSVRLPTTVPESPTSDQGIELPHPVSRRFSLQSLLHTRLPRESADSNSGATASNRLSTIISAHEVEEGDWSSLDNLRLPDIG